MITILSGRSSGVERNLAKVEVEGSNPFARSKFYLNKSANSNNPIATKRKPCIFLMSNIFVLKKVSAEAVVTAKVKKIYHKASTIPAINTK